MSLADTIKYSTPSYFTSVPEYFSNITVSPILLPSELLCHFQARPSPTAITSPVCGFLLQRMQEQFLQQFFFFFRDSNYDAIA